MKGEPCAMIKLYRINVPQQLTYELTRFCRSAWPVSAGLHTADTWHACIDFLKYGSLVYVQVESGCT